MYTTPWYRLYVFGILAQRGLDIACFAWLQADIMQQTYLPLTWPLYLTKPSSYTNRPKQCELCGGTSAYMHEAKIVLPLTDPVEEYTVYLCSRCYQDYNTFRRKKGDLP